MGPDSGDWVNGAEDWRPKWIGARMERGCGLLDKPPRIFNQSTRKGLLGGSDRLAEVDIQILSRR